MHIHKLQMKSYSFYLLFPMIDRIVNVWVQTRGSAHSRLIDSTVHMQNGIHNAIIAEARRNKLTLNE